jgi:hypothetical protein
VVSTALRGIKEFILVLVAKPMRDVRCRLSLLRFDGAKKRKTIVEFATVLKSESGEA